MASDTYDTTIQQGKTFRRVIRFEDPDGEPVDLTGHVARLQARKKKSDALTVLDLTLGDGLTIDELAGEVTVYISDEDTAQLEFGSAFYDLELVTPSGEVPPDLCLSGRVFLEREVTR